MTVVLLFKKEGVEAWSEVLREPAGTGIAFSYQR